MIPEQSIKEWQSIWTQLLDMAYHRKNIVTFFGTTFDFSESWRRDPNFDKLTFDYTWEKYSRVKDENGEFIEPKIVPELTKLCVPVELFHCLGSEIFIKKCFPNAELIYWEP